jgi:hypothetical protein
MFPERVQVNVKGAEGFFDYDANHSFDMQKIAKKAK